MRPEIKALRQWQAEVKFHEELNLCTAYLQLYCEQGYEEYLRLADFMREFPTWPITYAAAHLMLWQSQSTPEFLDSFCQGRFQFKYEQHARKIASLVLGGQEGQ